MRLGDAVRPQLDARLLSFPTVQRPLPGISTAVRRDSLVKQLIESIRRIEYVLRIRQRSIDSARANPESELFDPLKAATIHYRAGDIDEACWLVFLATHCGRHLIDRWQLSRDIYRGHGDGIVWTWRRVSASPLEFHSWLEAHYYGLANDGVKRRFGNHRKYETLKPESVRGTSRVVESYVAWVGANRGHGLLINEAVQAAARDPKAAFDYLYQSMRAVTSFGRTARFDFLTMIGKLGFADIEPGIPYFEGSTGPLAGARLLFGGSTTAKMDAKTLDDWAVTLGVHIGVGMQVMEDATCNWQKSPDKFIPFRG
jgi:hypothetical protein